MIWVLVDDNEINSTTNMPYMVECHSLLNKVSFDKSVTFNDGEEKSTSSSASAAQIQGSTTGSRSFSLSNGQNHQPQVRRHYSFFIKSENEILSSPVWGNIDKLMTLYKIGEKYWQNMVENWIKFGQHLEFVVIIIKFGQYLEHRDMSTRPLDMGTFHPCICGYLLPTKF